MARPASDKSRESNAHDSLSDHAPLIFKHANQEEAENIQSLFASLTPADSNTTEQYRARYSEAAYAIFISGDSLLAQERAFLNSAMREKSEYCLLRYDRATNLLTSEFSAELFHQKWGEFAQSQSVSFSGNFTTDVWQETREASMRRDLFRNGRMVPTQHAIGTQDVSITFDNTADSKAAPKNSIPNISNFQSLIEHIQPHNKLIIVGENHSDTAAIGVINKFVTDIHPRVCFIEMLHSMHQPFLNRWMLEEADATDEMMQNLLRLNSNRGEENIAILRILRDDNVRPIAIDANLQTGSVFEREEERKEDHTLRRDDGNVIFAHYISKTLRELEGDKTSMCLIGGDHAKGVKQLLSCNNIRSEIIDLSSNRDDEATNTAKCFVGNGAVFLRVPTGNWEEIEMKAKALSDRSYSDDFENSNSGVSEHKSGGVTEHKSPSAAKSDSGSSVEERVEIGVPVFAKLTMANLDILERLELSRSNQSKDDEEIKTEYSQNNSSGR